MITVELIDGTEVRIELGQGEHINNWVIDSAIDLSTGEEIDDSDLEYIYDTYTEFLTDCWNDMHNNYAKEEAQYYINYSC